MVIIKRFIQSDQPNLSIKIIAANQYGVIVVKWACREPYAQKFYIAFRSVCSLYIKANILFEKTNNLIRSKTRKKLYNKQSDVKIEHNLRRIYYQYFELEWF